MLALTMVCSTNSELLARLGRDRGRTAVSCEGAEVVPIYLHVDV